MDYKQAYEWLAPKMSTPERESLDIIYARVAGLEALMPFLVHANLNCDEGCTCGLDALTDAIRLPRCDAHPT